MMSQDERLLPLSHGNLDRPLRDLAQPATVAVVPASDIHLRDYLSVVLKRKWLILSIVIVVTSLVAIQMYRLPDVYQAETTLQIEPKTSVLQTQGLVVTAPRDSAYWNTQIRLLDNPELARMVVLTLDLQNNPAFLGGQAQGSLFSALRRLVSRDKSASMKESGVAVASDAGLETETLSPKQLAQIEPYEDAVRANVTVFPIKDTNLVSVRFQHTNPEIATKVAGALADVFIYKDIQRQTAGANTASAALSRQIADLQLKIKQGEEARLNYLKNHDLPLNPSAKGGNLTLERLSAYSSQLLDAENARKNIQASYEASLREPDVWSIPEVQESKVIQRLREKIGDLEEQKSALLVQYTPEWPAVKRVDAQIKRLKQDLDRAPREILTSLKTRYESAVSREAKVRRDYFQERGVANQQNEAEIAMGNLNQQLATNKEFYRTLFQRQKELEITSTDRANTVTIATPARLPRAPIGPARLRNILVALLLSLGTGIGLAFLLDYLDDTLKTIEDVDRYVHLPTLALIPAPRAARLLSKGKEAAPSEEGESTALALISDVRSPIAEAYRHLRTSLLLSSAGQPPKTVLVTSSQPSEGKTTTAINTAVMLAQTGADVLILDCDLRRPRIHAHFGLPNALGASNYLSGETDLDALIQTYDKLPNLKIMTSGPVPPNAAELLGSDEMRKLLHTLGERFAHIIIDSPPAISFTDASILSTLVDGVVLVVHGGRSSRAVVRRAKQQLMDVGGHIFGIVLNNVKLDAQDYSYYVGYYSSYYEDDDDDAEAAAEAAAADRPGANG